MWRRSVPGESGQRLTPELPKFVFGSPRSSGVLSNPEERRPPARPRSATGRQSTPPKSDPAHNAGRVALAVAIVVAIALGLLLQNDAQQKQQQNQQLQQLQKQQQTQFQQQQEQAWACQRVQEGVLPNAFCQP